MVARHGWLRDFDVVYSAHLSPYGAVPAALQHSPNTEVSVHVLHLTGDQLAAIHATEPNYLLCRLEGIRLELDDGGRLEEVDAHLTRWGCLSVNGAERALSAVRARGRAFAQLGEEAVLGAVRDQLAPDQDLDEFIADGTADPLCQKDRSTALSEQGLRFAWSAWQRLEG